MTVNALSAGTLTGDTVKNRADEELGTVEEIMIDLDRGQIAYVVMAAGGFLGIGDKYFAIPWSLLEVDTDSHAVIVDLDKETIENAPGFDKDNWPDPSDVGWLNRVYAYHRVEPYWADRS
jgi:sporulation protein YlmC with PRC-barrel domain